MMTPIEKALLTWYKPSNPLYKDPEPFTDGLIAETGELYALYKNERWKDGFSWFDCKHCKQGKDFHFNKLRCDGKLTFFNPKIYTPKVLDELGDVWYYLRVAYWFYDMEFEEDKEDFYSNTRNSIISMMISSIALDTILKQKISLKRIYTHFRKVLKFVDCPPRRINRA